MMGATKTLLLFCCCFAAVNFCQAKNTAGCQMVTCFVPPCDFAKCDSFPNAECRDNYCGGCNAEFYDSGRLLTEAECSGPMLAS